MEVSTVSPPPTSPTEGDDLCEIDFTNLAIHGVTLLICPCGLFGNGAVLCLLPIKLTTFLIFNQAITDFLFLLFMVPTTLLFLSEDVSCSSLVPLMYLSLLFQLSLFSYYIGLYRLMFTSIERCRSIVCPLCCGCQLPERLSWVVDGALYWTFLFVAMAVNPTVTFLCQSHKQENCQGALSFLYAVYLLLSAAPLVIASTILFIYFKSGSQQQQIKRVDIVIFFIVLFSLPLSLWDFLQQLGYTVVSSQLVFLLTCIHSTIKPFIYFSVGSWRSPCSMGSFWRQWSVETLRTSVQRVFEEAEGNTAHSNDGTTDTGV